MADNYQYYHVTSASFAMTIEQMYDNHPNQRLLQNFNSTPENDREAGFISVGLLTGVILLSLSLFLCNALVSKFCPSSGLLDDGGDARNTIDDTTMHGLPYSSEIRQMYLESSLKSQEFCSAIHSSTSITNSATSADIEKGCSTMRISGANHIIEKAEEGKDKVTQGNKDATYDVDLVDCKTYDDSHDNDNLDDTMPQCLICFETFVDGDAVTTHCTNKIYHRRCIMEWLLKHNKCPYCRRPFFQRLTTTMNDNEGIATLAPASSAIVPIVATRSGANTSTTMTR